MTNEIPAVAVFREWHKNWSPGEGYVSLRDATDMWGKVSQDPLWWVLDSRGIGIIAVHPHSRFGVGGTIEPRGLEQNPDGSSPYGWTIDLETSSVWMPGTPITDQFRLRVQVHERIVDVVKAAQNDAESQEKDSEQ